MLNVNLGADTNVDGFSARYDLLGADRRQATGLDDRDRAPTSRPTRRAGAADDARRAARRVGGDRPRQVLLSRPGCRAAASSRPLAQAVVDRSAMSLTAEGTVNGGAYGRVLKAKRPVLVRGAGQQFSGTYYVERVLHELGQPATPSASAAPQRLRRDAPGELPGRPRSARRSRRSGYERDPGARRRRRRPPTASTASTAALVTDVEDPQNQGRIRATRARGARRPRSRGWALPAAPYAGPGVGSFTIPPVGAGVWIEFEAGRRLAADLDRLLVGRGDRAARTSRRRQATPPLKIVRTEKGLHGLAGRRRPDDLVSDENGKNILKIEVQEGQVTIKGATKVVVEAPQIELVESASHPVVFGDDLLQLPATARADVPDAHAPGRDGRRASPVTPAPPCPRSRRRRRDPLARR